LAVLESYNQH